MAARRERERRRPNGERRYRFATPEPELEAEEGLLEADDGTTDTAEPAPPPAKTRSARTATPSAPTQTRPVRTAKPFSSYRDEYAYVYGDLRRVELVVGSLLVVLIVLYFVLPLLVR
jgi:hypothetical protein